MSRYMFVNNCFMSNNLYTDEHLRTQQGMSDVRNVPVGRKREEDRGSVGGR